MYYAYLRSENGHFFLLAIMPGSPYWSEFIRDMVHEHGRENVVTRFHRPARSRYLSFGGK